MNKITVSYNGMDYIGGYTYDNEVITVSLDIYKKSTQLGGHLPELLANMLIKEIIKENSL